MIRLGRWLSRVVLRGPDAPFIRHDLEEIYARDRAQGLSSPRAGWRYTRLALASMSRLRCETISG